MSKEFKKWEDGDNIYRKIGDSIVLCDGNIYNYDDDCWKYAPDIYFEYCLQSNDFDYINEDEARRIVESEGGKNFDKRDELLFETDEDGKYSGV